jgi:hypothetical protein
MRTLTDKSCTEVVYDEEKIKEDADPIEFSPNTPQILNNSEKKKDLILIEAIVPRQHPNRQPLVATKPDDPDLTPVTDPSFKIDGNQKQIQLKSGRRISTFLRTDQ